MLGAGAAEARAEAADVSRAEATEMPSAEVAATNGAAALLSTGAAVANELPNARGTRAPAGKAAANCFAVRSTRRAGGMRWSYPETFVDRNAPNLSSAIRLHRQARFN